jgi:hypothetical protein
MSTTIKLRLVGLLTRITKLALTTGEYHPTHAGHCIYWA